MNKKTLRWMLAGVVGVGVAGAIALKVARATPPQGVTATLLAGPTVMDEIHVVSESPEHGVMIKTRGLSDAYAQFNLIAPGGHTGWHSHPGPVFVLVTAGTLTVYDANDRTRTPAVYPAGTGFVDEPGNTHIGRNEGATDLELFALFLVPQGAPRRIDEPRPRNYPF